MMGLSQILQNCANYDPSALSSLFISHRSLLTSWRNIYTSISFESWYSWWLCRSGTDAMNGEYSFHINSFGLLHAQRWLPFTLINTCTCVKVAVRGDLEVKNCDEEKHAWVNRRWSFLEAISKYSKKAPYRCALILHSHEHSTSFHGRSTTQGLHPRKRTSDMINDVD